MKNLDEDKILEVFTFVNFLEIEPMDLGYPRQFFNLNSVDDFGCVMMSVQIVSMTVHGIKVGW